MFVLQGCPMPTTDELAVFADSASLVFEWTIEAWDRIKHLTLTPPSFAGTYLQIICIVKIILKNT